MSKNVPDLFAQANPFVEQALQRMTPEQIQYYKNWGKHMYKDNFTDTKMIEALPCELEMQAVQVEEYVRSGLDIKHLSKNDIAVLKRVRGTEWWKNCNLDEDEIEELRLPNIFKQHIDKSVEKKIKQVEKKIKRDKKNEKRNKNRKKK